NSKFNNRQAETLLPMYQSRIESNELEQLPQPLSFQYLAKFRQTPNVMQMQGPKQKYGYGMGYTKKALDLAIRTNKIDEFVSEIECFIEKVKRDQDDNDNIDPTDVGDPLR
ncbi:588_t:CDS:1, partial [Cetraspora pellucida]